MAVTVSQLTQSVSAAGGTYYTSNADEIITAANNPNIFAYGLAPDPPIGAQIWWISFSDQYAGVVGGVGGAAWPVSGGAAGGGGWSGVSGSAAGSGGVLSAIASLPAQLSTILTGGQQQQQQQAGAGTGSAASPLTSWLLIGGGLLLLMMVIEKKR